MKNFCISSNHEAGRRHPLNCSEITSAGAQLAKFFLLNQSWRDRLQGFAKGYSIIRKEKRRKNHSPVIFLPRLNAVTIQRKGKRVLMDSLGYTFFILGIDVYSLSPPLLLLSSPSFLAPVCNQLEIQLPTHPFFHFRKRKRGREGTLGSAIQSGQFSVGRICCFYSK